MGRGSRSNLAPLFLIVILVLAAFALSTDARQSGDQQITVTVNATCTGNYHLAGDGMSLDDNLSITLHERTVYRIVKYDNGEGGTDLEVLSYQGDVTPSGSGILVSNVRTVRWGYTLNQQPAHSVSGIHLSLAGGASRVAMGRFVGLVGVTGADGFAPGLALNICDAAMNEAEREIPGRPANTYQEGMHARFAPNMKNLFVSGGATYSYRPPDNASSGMLEVQYSISGGDATLPEAAILLPDMYERWLPEGGESESVVGNETIVTVLLHKPGDLKQSADKKGKIRFMLKNVSSERGVCMNWPEKEDAHDGPKWPDLKINPDVNPHLDVAKDGQSATTKQSVDSATVRIASYDYASYGRLMASVQFDVGGEVTATVEGGSRYDLVLPKDDNDNHVADWWEKQHAGDAADADADKDNIPSGVGGAGDDGDGLSLYEEYRGFMQQRVHVRTEPLIKDLFVWDRIGRGIGDFAQSGIRTHLIAWNEFTYESGEVNDGVINANRGYKTKGQQHFLTLEDKILPGLFGEAQGNGPGTPRSTRSVAINVATCMKRNEEHAGWGDEQVRKTTAHEMAHACNVWHHGSTNYDVAEWEEQDDTGTWQRRARADGTAAGVAARGGQESGVQDCVMRYVGTSFYEAPSGKLRWITNGATRHGERYGPAEAPGHAFCTSAAGTGVNAAGQKAGDAAKGNCRSQFCVNDQKHR